MKYPVVCVEWEDANRSGEWSDNETINANPSPCVSVGFLICEGPRAITLALTDGGNQVCCQMTIPRGMITKISTVATGSEMQVGLKDHE